MSVPPILSSQLWGLLCGGILGALRTSQTTAHLLAKNRLLESDGLPHLPGVGHWEVMTSNAPTWAGALFFGLSLGLGAGSLCAVWCRVARSTPGRTGDWLQGLVLFVPLLALVSGDSTLAVCLLAIAWGSWALSRAARAPHTLGWRLALLAVLSTGLAPWVLAPEGAFTRLRDQVLFASPGGLAVDQFYYRWTLYPAEVLKPLAARTQPLAAIPPDLPLSERQRWCNEARHFGVLCVVRTGAPPGSDLTISQGTGSVELVSGGMRVSWPREAAAQQESWQALSKASDTHRALRRATGLSLFVGCPLGLCWLLSSVVLRLGSLVPAGLRRRLATVGLAAAFAAWFGVSGVADTEIADVRAELSVAPPSSPNELGRQLRSPRVAERFYAARAARHLGPAAEPLLIDSLGDPVLNVRYAAAQSLGEVGGSAARTALVELLEQPEEWYVKERAYVSLRRRGWLLP